jgi:aspartate kinase
MNQSIVAKFGGTSLADAGQFRKVIDIIRSQPTCQHVVVSAPGKRFPDDEKVTDLFYSWHRNMLNDNDSVRANTRSLIQKRFEEIARDLDISFDICAELDQIETNIRQGYSMDYAASRGEYLSAKIMARALHWNFVDAVDCIGFNEWGTYIQDYARIQKTLCGKEGVVVPGFYGSLPGGRVKTFSRGGSDITGAIIASAVQASVYQNWTDVSGLLMVDPRVIKNPKRIHQIRYALLRELTYAGACVFHEEAMFPVQDAGIVTNIRNTNDPSDRGTYIVPYHDTSPDAFDLITGIASRKNFTVVTLCKRLMNQEVGFVRKLLSVLERYGISFEHMPSGIDTVSLIIDSRQLDGKLDTVVSCIKKDCAPDSVDVFGDIALIAVVGQGMAYTPGIAAKICGAIANQSINIRMINQGASETTILIGVRNDDCDLAVRAIYDTCVN